MDIFSDDYEVPKPVSVWQENHGNWLLGLVVLIGLIGAVVLVAADRRSKAQGLDVRPQGQGEDSVSIAEDATSSEGDLVTIVVKGATDESGQMMLAIYNAADQFNDPNRVSLKAPRPIIGGTATWVVAAQKLPETFAIAAFHDQDTDGLLNRSVFGIPTEPYGFSSQASGKSGPPTFDQAVLSRPKGSETIEVFLSAAAE